MTSFNHIAHSYAEGPPKQVPGLAGLHRMMRLLLEERVPVTGRLLVLGAGGGMELSAFAEAQPQWRFDGVDPSAKMLDAAREATMAWSDRISLHEGKIDIAPEGPFDGATCLLVMHFLPRDERIQTLRELQRRLTPGAPLVLAHMSYDQDEDSRQRWSKRNAAFSASNGMDPVMLENGRQRMLEILPIVPPDDDVALLKDAGFTGIELFYAAFGFRGWVGYAG
ncbi:class I SAM-dependent methyltransferase [Devosia aurantiaca]|uniref:Class I SAM-dependent methyltransferase n=1 Tax=Devosia aurantiaca TaxID=2714858 RepID=A0A6M1T093_9HYPH|nr:class I SAM-dependent methyltransferase [Devosia aurantiaca]NGP18311.1 class I SAM-dependent methyltransferase [Devosia aurantiaca]